MRYKYWTDNKRVVICESRFAGKKVTATVKCSPEDTFDYEYGCRLAQARLDQKIALKRVKKAKERINKARVNSFIAQEELEAAENYSEKVYKELIVTYDNYATILEER